MTTSIHQYDNASTMKNIFATMDDLLSSHDHDDHVAKAEHGLQLLDSIMTTTNSKHGNGSNELHSIYHSNLLTSSNKITTSLQSQIEYEASQLELESRDLSSKLQLVSSLENKVNRLTKEREDMMERKERLQTSIGVCQKAMAAMMTKSSSKTSEGGGGEGGGGGTSTTTTKKKMIPKIGKEISLHALMTNIRWDYDRTSTITGDNNNLYNRNENEIPDNSNSSILLAGEIFHPTTQKMKKFTIDKSECNNDEYEIADRLWNLMEG